jgi:hypothetical protein
MTRPVRVGRVLPAVPHMPVGIIVTLFTLLVLFWIFFAIRKDRHRDR